MVFYLFLLIILSVFCLSALCNVFLNNRPGILQRPILYVALVTFSGMWTFQTFIVFTVSLIFASAEWIDMSYTFDNQTVYWFGHTKFERKLGTKQQGHYYSTYEISGSEHGGTHSDAVTHFCEDGASVDQIPFEKLIGPAVVVNISEKAAKDPDYRLSVNDLQKWERDNGEIPDGAIVLMHSGWGKFWPNRKQFLNSPSLNRSDARSPGKI